MNAKQLLRVKELFLAASELPAGERQAWLDQQDVADVAVRDKVLRQLQRLDQDAEEIVAAGAGSFARREEAMPESIGPYRVLEQVGEGGMGVVYRAEQSAPVKRVVAVKRIKPGMDSRAVLARFDAERRVLARLEHPNIARVLDAGMDASGRPWFAMEWVEGRTITDYAAQGQMDTEARLDLFVEVCRGVEHAHQRGILHRDLKPSNVLVTEVDGRPVPKIIDFGVAKAMEGENTGQTLQTQLGLLVGTPEYMSPEQADPTEVVADTRSDVYSLGVLLYELLSGALPFDAARLRSAGLSGIARLLQSEEPPRPSTRVSTVVGAGAGELAARLRGDPKRLARRLRGDLDWITMRALRAVPEDRYASVGALAEDLMRHLRGEPVEAGPPTLRYRLSKYVRRHRGQVLAAGLVIVSLVGGTVVSLGFARDAQRQAAEARQARDVARQAQDAAERSAADARMQRDAARRITGVLSGALASFDPDQSPDGAAEISDFLRQTADLAREQLAGQPQIEAELLTTLGSAAWTRGELELATVWLRRALELRDADPATTDAQLHEVLWPYAWTLWHTGSMAGVGMWRRMVQTSRRVVCEDAPELERPMREIRSWVDGNLVFELPDPGGTVDQLMVTARASLARDDQRWLVLGDFLSSCAVYAVEANLEIGMVERLLREALAVYEERVGLGASHTRIALAYEAMMDAWFRAGEFERARAAAASAAVALSRSLQEGHWQLALYRAWVVLAEIELGGAPDAASVARLRMHVDELLETIGPQSGVTPRLLVPLVRWAREVGDTKVAERYRAALASGIARYPSDAAWGRFALPPGMEELGECLERLDERAMYSVDPSTLVPLFEETLRLAREIPADATDLRMVMHQTLLLYYDKCNRDVFIPAHPDLIQDLLEFCREASLHAGPGYVSFLGFYIAESIWAADPARAAALMLADAREREAAIGDHYFAEVDRMFIGKCLWLQGRREEGLAAMRASLRAFDATVGVFDYNARPAFVRGMRMHESVAEQRDFAEYAVGVVREMLLGGAPGGLLNGAAWAVVRARGLDAGAYALALQATREATADNRSWARLHTLAVALYRCGQSAEALQILQECRSALRAAGTAPNADVELCVALAHQALGETGDAQAALRQAQQLLAGAEPTAEQRVFLEEAQAALQSR